MTTPQTEAQRMADAIEQRDYELKLADVAALLRRQEEEITQLKRQIKADEVGASYHLEVIDKQDELLRQVLNDVCSAKLCEVNSMSSRAEARRLLDKATEAIRNHLEAK